MRSSMYTALTRVIQEQRHSDFGELLLRALRFNDYGERTPIAWIFVDYVAEAFCRDVGDDGTGGKVRIYSVVLMKSVIVVIFCI